MSLDTSNPRYLVQRVRILLIHGNPLRFLSKLVKLTYQCAQSVTVDHLELHCQSRLQGTNHDTAS